MSLTPKALFLTAFCYAGLFMHGPATDAGAAPSGSSETRASSPLGALGGNNKDPIKIDADRLDVFDKENRAVFAGNVVAVQGETTMRCTTLTVFYEQNKDDKAKPDAKPAAPSSESAIRKIDCKGPVTLVTRDQVATGNNATFDRVVNKVIMTGNVALSQGQNVTRGEKILYDVNTGIANVETVPGGRVKALFVPGSEEGEKPAKKKTP